MIAVPRIELREHLVHYQQIGQGPDVLLIHGLFCNIAFWWFHVAPRLAESRRVTAFDLRGHGFSGMSDAGYRAIDLAEDVTALMDHLRIARTHVIGHSFGGAVALALAVEHPERVSRLTLADVWVPSLQQLAPLSEGPGWPALRGRLAARGIVVDGDMPKVAQALYEEILGEEDDPEKDAPNEAPPGQELASRLLRGALQFGANPDGSPTRAMRRWQRLMELTAARRELHDPTGLEPERLRGISRPADLIYGARSRYRPSGEALERLLPSARRVSVPDAGHFFPLLKPEALLEAVTEARPPQALPRGTA